MLWPGTPTDDIQIIDVRDFANFTVDCLEQKIVGTFNTVTPMRSFKMSDLLQDSMAVTGADMTPVWVDKEFISENEVAEGGGSADLGNIRKESMRPFHWLTEAARSPPD